MTTDRPQRTGRSARADADAVEVVMVELPVDPSAPSRARHALVDFAREAGLGGELLDDLALAVTEAVTNAVVHGFHGRPSGRVLVIADLLDDVLELVVTDDGGGIRPGTPSDGAGLGLKVMAGLCAELQISDVDPHGTEVWMRFLVG